jgi:hypothetical protein
MEEESGMVLLLYPCSATDHFQETISLMSQPISFRWRGTEIKRIERIDNE